MPKRDTILPEDLTVLIDGAVTRSLSLDYRALEEMPETAKVIDVSRFHPNRCGDAVLLDAVLAIADPRPTRITRPCTPIATTFTSRFRSRNSVMKASSSIAKMALRSRSKRGGPSGS